MKTFILSLQHLLAMYAGAILVPIIVGTSLDFTPEQIAFLVTVDIFMCGLATFLQVWKGTGTGLPIVLGCTFTAVAPMILIGQTKGIGDLYGSLFLSGILVVIIAPFFSYLVKFFPPVVTGSVVTIIGINLMPVAMNYLAGGEGAKIMEMLKHHLRSDDINRYTCRTKIDDRIYEIHRHINWFDCRDSTRIILWCRRCETSG